MKLINDTNVLLKLNCIGATHARISIDKDIWNEEWVPINEDRTISFTIPNIYGFYNIQFQVKNPYGISEILTEQLVYVEVIDQEAPSTPSNLIVTNSTTDSLTISWDESVDNVMVNGYIVECNGSTQNVLNNSVTLSGLFADTEYNITVKSIDSVGNISAPASITALTESIVVAVPMQGNIVISQVFCPTSTIVNTQDGIVIDHCFVTLYNKSNSDISINDAKLYWKYASYPSWHKVNLSGIVKSKSHFLIRGSKVTGLIAGTNILMDWSLRAPDLDCSVDWSAYVDQNPEDTTNAEVRQVQWAVDNNLLFVGSKTGAVYLSAKEHVGELPENPFLSKSTLPDYVDEVGLLGSGEVNPIAETAPISGTKKTMVADRKIVDSVMQDTDNNNADFILSSVNLLTTGDVIAKVKNSTNG